LCVDVVVYLLEADDALLGVAVSGDGEGVGALGVDDGVFLLKECSSDIHISLKRHTEKTRKKWIN